MSFARGALAAVQAALNNTRRVPMFVWIYLGVILYLYRRMTRDFLGMGTRRKHILGRIKLDLTKEEETLADSIVDPKDLSDTFSDIGGLDDAKKLLTEHVVWPFSHPELFPAGSLRSHPTGVLLYGPPGTGKTMLARAIAKELNGYFLEVRIEKLFTKWVGDSEKLAAAVFSLARKLGSCVIFIDEVDSLLSQRTDADSTVYNHAKTIFLTQWDGLVQNDERSKIIVVGATNRPKSLDEAIVRRMPIRVPIPLPDVNSRRDILSLVLRKDLDGVVAADRLLSAVAKRTEGYSGSDLKELCKAAVMGPLRKVMNKSAATLPPLDMSHFDEALQTVRPSSQF